MHGRGPGIRHTGGGDPGKGSKGQAYRAGTDPKEGSRGSAIKSMHGSWGEGVQGSGISNRDGCRGRIHSIRETGIQSKD